MVALSLFRVKEGGGPIYKSEVDISFKSFKIDRVFLGTALDLFEEHLGKCWELFHTCRIWEEQKQSGVCEKLHDSVYLK